MTWFRLILVALLGMLVGSLSARRRTVPSVDRAASEDGDALEVLDREVLRARSVQTFPTAYVTLLSIVQGIALGVLATAFVPQLQEDNVADIFSLASEALATATVIVVVFYNYVWFLLIFRWSPGALDTVIPFTLGIGEISLSSTIGLHSFWILLLAVMQVIGALAFVHTLWRASPRMFSERRTLRDTTRLLRILIFILGAGAALALIVYVLLDRLWTATPAILALTIVAIGVSMVILSERVVGRIYRRYRLVRLPTFGSIDR